MNKKGYKEFIQFQMKHLRLTEKKAKILFSNKKEEQKIKTKRKKEKIKFKKKSRGK